jgi:hypothetical protein
MESEKLRGHLIDPRKAEQPLATGLRSCFGCAAVQRPDVLL